MRDGRRALPRGSLLVTTRHCRQVPPGAHPRSPHCLAFYSDLRARFIKRVREFMAALADAHRTAHSERTDSREELESLLNLMTRLDFNGWVWVGGCAGWLLGYCGTTGGWAGGGRRGEWTGPQCMTGTLVGRLYIVADISPPPPHPVCSFFSAQAPPREAGLAAAGSERMTVKFAA